MSRMIAQMNFLACGLIVVFYGWGNSWFCVLRDICFDTIIRFSNVILFRAINISESINVVTFAYRLEYFCSLEYKRNNSRVYCSTELAISMVFKFMIWACMIKQNNMFTFKIFLIFKILEVHCIMQISNEHLP